MKWQAVLITILCGTIAFCQGAERPASSSRFGGESPLKLLTTLNEAAMQYYWWLKQVPTSLTQLGPTNGKVGGHDAADLIPHDLAGGIVDGYKYVLVATSKTDWVITATPIKSSEDEIYSVYRIESHIRPSQILSPK